MHTIVSLFLLGCLKSWGIERAFPCKTVTTSTWLPQTINPHCWKTKSHSLCPPKPKLYGMTCSETWLHGLRCFRVLKIPGAPQRGQRLLWRAENALWSQRLEVRLSKGANGKCTEKAVAMWKWSSPDVCGSWKTAMWVGIQAHARLPVENLIRPISSILLISTSKTRPC